MRKILLALLLCIPLLAENVNVKYFGSVDLNSYTCNYTQSSFVHRICFNQSEQKAIVLLNDTYYQYCGMSKYEVDNWLNANSKGKYFNAFIKGRYSCR